VHQVFSQDLTGRTGAIALIFWREFRRTGVEDTRGERIPKDCSRRLCGGVGEVVSSLNAFLANSHGAEQYEPMRLVLDSIRTHHTFLLAKREVVETRFIGVATGKSR
jgi:hypothetical protein